MNHTLPFSVMNDSRLLLVGLLTIVSCLGVSGCTTTPTEPRAPSPTQQALVGKTQKVLKSCARIPPLVTTVTEVTELKYYKEASQFEESFAGTKSSVARPHHGCWATLRLTNGVVTEVQYRSVPRNYLTDHLCDEIFAKCVGP